MKHLFKCGEDTGFHVRSHDLFPNDVSMKVRNNDDDGTYVKSELWTSNFQYHTHEVSTNNGQSQIRLTYNDFLYDAKKGNRNIMVIK